MPDKKLTDKEIIAAMEWCYGCTSDKCRNCPLEDTAFCEEKLQDLSIDLINRTKANEIHYRRKVQNQRETINALQVKIDNLQAKVDFLTEQRDSYMQDATEFSQKCDRQQAEIKRLELFNTMLTNNCDNKQQWIQHLEDEIRKLVLQQGPKGERGKSGMRATCPACGRNHEDITWVADIDVCKCACGWQSEPGDCDYKKPSCYKRELYKFVELMKQTLPSYLHPVVDIVLKEMENNIV